MQRPVGVTILAVLALIGGVLAWLGGLTVVGLGTLGVAMPGFTGSGPLAGWAALSSGLAQFAGGALLISFGIGFLQLRRWAWVLAIAGQVLGILGQLVWMGSHNVAGGLVSLALAGGVLWYLLRPDVRRAFGVA